MTKHSVQILRISVLEAKFVRKKSAHYTRVNAVVTYKRSKENEGLSGPCWFGENVPCIRTEKREEMKESGISCKTIYAKRTSYNRKTFIYLELPAGKSWV